MSATEAEITDAVLLVIVHLQHLDDDAIARVARAVYPRLTAANIHPVEASSHALERFAGSLRWAN